jgi:hypothetical protein
MSEKQASIYDGLKYLYAEQLKGKEVTLTIKRVQTGIEFSDNRGMKSIGNDIHFDETDKILGVTGITVRRQLAMATGEDAPDKMVGKRITLFTVASAKSATGKAIRIKGAA